MSAKKTVFIPLSGFLGAGKTTLMLSAAELLRARGLNVACITNDQGGLLVDSSMVESKGIPLGQVRGGCFCCRFNDLTDAVLVLMASHRPDIILAEAVGSCTDLTATVIRPLQSFHGDIIIAKPLTTVIDPLRLEDMLADDGGGRSAFSEEISYIFHKQLEDASCLLLNKTDLLPSERIEHLLRILRTKFPAVHVLCAASNKGLGVDEWLDCIMSAVEVESAIALDIDYDTYTAGEAQLGWLNVSFTVEGTVDDVAGFSNALVDRLADGMNAEDAEIAHLKLWAQDDRNQLKISRVRYADSNQTDMQPAELWKSKHVTVWLNARIKIDDTLLKDQVLISLECLRTGSHLDVTVHELECFAPSRPVPTYRMGVTS